MGIDHTIRHVAMYGNNAHVVFVIPKNEPIPNAHQTQKIDYKQASKNFIFPPISVHTFKN
jgi:hypothetical protein